MANDLDVTLGFQGEDEGASALVRQLMVALRQLQTEERAARTEERRARQQARQEAAAERRARREATNAARQESAVKRQAAQQDRQSAAAATRARREQVMAERAAARAQRESEVASRRNAAALRDQGSAAGGTNRIVGALGRQLAILAASLGAAFSVQRALSAGLSLNETIETSTLGIASLINAQTELEASDGRVLAGREKLDGAFAIATDQVNQLRIAGLTTAATTTQLVEAFQQAIGAGTSAGLAIDQVRSITILAVQAATALGVPLNQLNQEVRALLDGNIDRNARVATALQITGAQVQQARQTGQLFEFLTERLGSFAVSGEAVAGTLAGIRSNVAEVLQTFAAFATAPLFDRLKEIGAETFDALFDGANLQVQEEFQGVLQFGTAIATAIADVLGRTVRGLLAAAQRMGEFFEENELSIRGVLEAGGELASQFGQLVVAAGEFVAGVLGAGETSEAFAGILLGVANVLQFVRENLILAVTAFAAFKIAALASLVPVVAILGPYAVAIRVAAAAVGLLIAAIGAAEARRRAQQLAQLQAIEAQGAEAVEVARLTRAYNEQADAINSGKLKGDDLVKARQRLKDIADDLIAISPDYIKTFTDEATAARETTEALLRADLARRQSLKSQESAARGRIIALQLEERQLTRELEGAREAGPRNAGRSETEVRARLRRVADDLEAQRELATSLEQQFNAAEAAAQGIEVPGITPGGGGTGTGTGTGNDLEQQVAAETKRVEAALAEQKELLDQQLADNLLSYREYYTRLQAETEGAIDAQLVQQRRLLAGTTDPGERAQVTQQIESLEAERARAGERFARERLDAEQALADQVTQLTIRLYEAQGDAVQARNLQLEREFQDLRRRLEAEGDAAGLAILNRLVNLEAIRTRIGAVEGELRTLREDLSTEERRIELAQQSGAISAEEAQRQLADAYRRTSDRIRAQLPLLRQLAAAAGTDEARRQVAALEVESARLDVQAAQLSDTLLSFRQDARQALVSDLSQFLASGEQGVQNFAEAVTRLLGNVAQSFRDLLAERASQELAASLFDPGALFGPERPAAGAAAAGEAAVSAAAEIAPSVALLSTTATTLTAGSAALTAAAGALALPTGSLIPGAAALTGAAGALLPATIALAAAAANLYAAAAVLTVARAGAGFAHGGYIGGPAHPVDSIPIWVTGGEFVINPESTRRHRALLETINRDRAGNLRAPELLMPVPRHSRNQFANGGLVADARAGASRAPAASRDRAALSVEASPDLIVRQLRTQRGESAWLDVAVKNRRALRDLLDGVR